MNAAIGELGGEFPLHWPWPDGGLLPWPEGAVFYTSGRSALGAICARRRLSFPDARLWLPAYFCSEVVEWLVSRGTAVAFYADDPCQERPDLSQVRMAKGDMLLAVNYFGVRSQSSGREDHAWSGDVLWIEDHTHDPVSTWAQSSRADYAFASLRKTLPVPDGAVLWSPARRTLPQAAVSGQHTGSAVKFAAQVCKRIYQDFPECPPALKQSFRELEMEGERLLTSEDAPAMAPWSEAMLRRGLPAGWRRRRESNVRRVTESAARVRGGKALFTGWPGGHCPLNPVYLFDDAVRRDEARQRLISARIYTPVHWPIHHVQNGRAVEISKRLLTIPVDHRAGDDQLEHVITVLKRC